MAQCHLSPRRRESVARMVSPETRLSVSPSSKATSAAISRVQRLKSRPRIPLESGVASPLRPRRFSGLKQSRVRRGREDLATRASTPLALKSWMASRTVCWPHPRFVAIWGILISPRRSQEHLRTAQRESVLRAQPGFEDLALSIRKRTYKDWSFHGYYCNARPETYSEDALGNLTKRVQHTPRGGRGAYPSPCLLTLIHRTS